MVYTFLLTCFIIFNETFSSYGMCNYDFKDSRSAIPPECKSLDCKVRFETPMNHICSIAYLVYTENNRNSPCYIEPENEEINQCEFDPCRKTKILIHGYLTKLKPGNLFELIKDRLLSIETYNVIIVNWTKYNDGLYIRAFENAHLVGIQVGKFINFLVNEKEVDPANVHIIGHSLGAHVAGVAGKQVPNLGRITGLDAAAALYSKSVTFNRLTDSDADFVDVIHCSNGVIDIGTKGFGIPSPIGDVNFYPNGGIYQPSCKLGRNYTDTDGDSHLIKSNGELRGCRHDICPIYFLYSIRDCKFLSRMCYSYERYKMGSCFSRSHLTAKMGLHTKNTPGLPSHSKFYLNTTAFPPYCLEN